MAVQAARATAAAASARKDGRFNICDSSLANPRPERRRRLPPDSVVLAVIARPAPERAVRLVEHDGVDRPGGALLVGGGEAHLPQLGAGPRRRGLVQQD